MRVCLLAAIFGALTAPTQAKNVIYVDAAATGANVGTTWTDAFTDLQAGLAAAMPGSEIWVANGVYKPAGPGGSRTAVFRLKGGVKLFGGFEGADSVIFPGGETERSQRIPIQSATILSGDLNGDDGPAFTNYSENSYHVVDGSGLDASSELDGFTITGGNANGGGNDNFGGGILSLNGGPTIRHCVLLKNRCADDGAGICSTNGLIRIENCRFLGNAAPSSGGGMFHSQNDITLINCEFSGNSAVKGGGLRTGVNCVPTLVNCTFTDNYVELRENADGINGGGVYIDGTAYISNCIFWHNKQNGWGGEPAQLTVTTPIINYSCVEGWTGKWAGTGNIGNDPLLLDPDGADNVSGTMDDNLLLRADSPCLDAGGNGYVPADSGDLDGDGDLLEPVSQDLFGNSRFQDDPNVPDTGDGTSPLVDMGAHEGPTQGFVLDNAPVLVFEGNPPSHTSMATKYGVFLVALAADPQRTVNVTVKYQSGDSDIVILSGSNLTFDSTNYSLFQPVVLAALEDDDFVNGEALLRISADGIQPADVIAVEQDNDPAPQVIFVDLHAKGRNIGLSWMDAFTNLQDALYAAAHANGRVSEIWVAQGRYTPSDTDQEASFQLVSGLALYGGFAGNETLREDRDPLTHETVLSGDLKGDDGPSFTNTSDNSRHVVNASVVDDTAILDGFTISGGNAEGDWWNQRMGGGMYNWSGSPRVARCRFIENHAQWDGAGVHNNRSSTPTFTDCDFTGNLSGSSGAAMMNVKGASPLITHCRFLENHALDDGGAFKNTEDTSTVADCVFKGNTAITNGGAMVLGGRTSIIECLFSDNAANNAGGAARITKTEPVFINCRFYENHSTYGGATQHFQTTAIDYINCLFSGNAATCCGGAIQSNGSTARLVNCTLAENQAPEGGGLHSWESTSTSTHSLTNCILWTNRDNSGIGEASQAYGGIRRANYSCIQGWTGAWGGVGNFGADPLFMDAVGLDGIAGTEDDNLRLGEGSPCIDAGDSTTVPADTLDLDGDGDRTEPIPLDLARAVRFFDDPSVINTGNGSPPIVDMGAYEFVAIPGDRDRDADVDADDLIAFELCASGPQIPFTGNCAKSDLDHDHDVDQSDFGILQRCYSGAGHPANPNCAN